VIDPTGAGDSFAGGFLGFLARDNEFKDFPFKQAVKFGTITASFCVEDFSLKKLSNLDWQDVEKRADSFNDFTGILD